MLWSEAVFYIMFFLYTKLCLSSIAVKQLQKFTVINNRCSQNEVQGLTEVPDSLGILIILNNLTPRKIYKIFSLFQMCYFKYKKNK